MRAVGTANWEAKKRAWQEVTLPVVDADSAEQNGPPPLTVKAVAAATQRFSRRWLGLACSTSRVTQPA